MRSYVAKFTRWKDGERRFREDYQILAEDFPAAYEQAKTFLAGLRSADPLGEFEIVSVETMDFTGKTCLINWYTSEEFAEVVEEKEAAE